MPRGWLMAPEMLSQKHSGAAWTQFMAMTTDCSRRFW